MLDLFKRFVGKAVTSYSGTASSVTPYLPQTVKLTDDPTKLMVFNRGYVAAANGKVSSAVATLPYHLYAVVDASRVGKLYTPHRGLSRGEAKAVATGSAIGRSMTDKKTVVEIYEHPFLDIMRKPSQGWSQTEWLHTVSAYLGLIGNCYLLKERKNGALTGLKPLHSEYVTIRYDGDGVITEYGFNPCNGMTAKTYAPADIVHIRNRDAGSIIAGRGSLENCLQAFATSTSAYNYVQALMNNMAVPGAMITFDNVTIPEGVNPSAYLKELELEALSRFGGRNRGKPFVSFGSTKFQKMDTSLADTRIETFVDGAKKEIAAAFGVPVSLLDDSAASRSTAYASQRAFHNYGVFPKAAAICDQLSAVLAEEYGPEFYYWWDPREAVDTDPVEQASMLTSYVSGGIMTVNESRQVLGLERVETPEADALGPVMDLPQPIQVTP